MHQVVAQVGDVLQEDRVVTHGDVIEQHQVLMDLAHVADVRHHRQTELARHQAHCEKLRNARQARAIGLYEMDRAGLDEVFEQHAVRHVFSKRDA